MNMMPQEKMRHVHAGARHQREPQPEAAVSFRTVERCLPSTSTFLPNDRYRTNSELENSVLEINHVTNVTTVLNETAASGWGSRFICTLLCTTARTVPLRGPSSLGSALARDTESCGVATILRVPKFVCLGSKRALHW